MACNTDSWVIDACDSFLISKSNIFERRVYITDSYYKCIKGYRNITKIK